MTSKKWRYGGMYVFRDGRDTFEFFERVDKTTRRVGFRLDRLTQGERETIAEVPCQFQDYRDAIGCAKAIADQRIVSDARKVVRTMSDE